MITAISGLIGLFIGYYFNELRHRREIGVKMIEIALGVLSEKPDQNKPALRNWAVKVLDKYATAAGVPLEREAEAVLRSSPLPVTTIFDAATGRYSRFGDEMMMGMPETLREEPGKAGVGDKIS